MLVIIDVTRHLDQVPADVGFYSEEEERAECEDHQLI